MTIFPDYELALLHLPARMRPSVEALFAIDSAMGEVVARATEPTLGRIKLAWWREQLEKLDHAPPPAEPRLKAVAGHLLPLGISGADIAELEAGWATLLEQKADAELVAQRGAQLFEMGGRLLGVTDSRLADAGAVHTLASASFRDRAIERLSDLRGHQFSQRVRPLTMLARAAAYDLSHGRTRGRVLAMLAHRWTGRIA